jgi:RNA polymerase sigma factor (sigma-70 family)
MGALMDDNGLLEAFARDGSDEAFRELVARHTNLVYACAAQRLRDPHAAQDVTQAVFLALALKAKGLRSGTSLRGWLYRATRFACAEQQRREYRRKDIEMRAFEEQPEFEPAAGEEADWEEVRPHLAGALDQLAEADREAVLLRFYQQASHREIGAELKISEDAAEKRVSRALAKLRRIFARKGAVLSLGALGSLLAANAAEAAPVGLAAAASETALAGASGTLAATKITVLSKGIIHMMFMAKVKTAALVAAGCVAVVGAGVALAPVVLRAAPAAGSKEVKFEAFEPDKYQSFIGNWDDQKHPALYAVIRSEKDWNQVFHAAAVMGGNKPFAPNPSVFEKQMLIVFARVVPAASGPGGFRVENVTVADNNLTLNFQYQAPKPAASYTVKSCVGVFVPKEDYASVAFVENGKQQGSLELKKGQWCVPESAKP